MATAETEAPAAKLDDVRSSVRLGLLANAILTIGYALALTFVVYNYTGRARETGALVAYFLGFALLILSGLIELSLDVCSVRIMGHGRYHSDSAVWNEVISFAFVSAGIMDVVAFVYWIEREFDVENAVLLVSSYVLLVMAILAVYFQMKELRESSWVEATREDKIDLVANFIVFGVSILGVVFRHMDHSGMDFGDATDQIELSTLVMWLFSSVLYVTTDVLRYKESQGIHV